MKEFNWKYLLLFLIAIPVVQQLGSYLGANGARNVNEKLASSHQKSTSDDIQVVASIQDAEGVTQNNFDLGFLQNLEAYTVERVKTKVREMPNSPQIDVSSEATYVESGPMKLAVIRLRGSDNTNQVMLFGIVGKELRRVLCVRNSTVTVPISYGVCAEKIKEVFGTTIGS